jgi:hypothetical protein
MAGEAQMRLNTAVVIAGFTLLAGIIFGERHLWIPASILVAGSIDLLTRRWYASDAVGEWMTLSILLKFVFSLIGFYATVGQLACLGLIVWWLVA